jgi:Na+/H+ antiporter NhaD/arsenite permease-like protein
LNIFSLQEAFTFVDWETIGLLFGMFILIVNLAEVGFFNWLANQVAKQLHYRPTYIFIAFPLLAAFTAAFMASITVILFLSALSVHIARIIKVDPIPLVVAEICAANTGGASTLVSDPPNVILGTMLGFNFNDFVIHAGPVAFVCMLAIVFIFYWNNRRMLQRAEREIKTDELREIDEGEQITNPLTLKIGLVGFGAAISLVVTHIALASVFGIRLSTATSALIPALLVVVAGGKETEHLIRKIDIESLVFFIGLFIIMGALEKKVHRDDRRSDFYVGKRQPVGFGADAALRLGLYQRCSGQHSDGSRDGVRDEGYGGAGRRACLIAYGLVISAGRGYGRQYDPGGCQCQCGSICLPHALLRE